MASDQNKYPVSRRNFIKVSAATTAGVSMLPLGSCNIKELPNPMKRKFGNFNFDVTTLGLGGQASIQWTGKGIDPVAIILKAFDMGINYFDTSNLYAKSQLHFHSAFKKLNLIPGEKNYNKNLRDSIWLTSKTGMRWGNPGWPEVDGVMNWSNGKNVQCAVDDVKRSLTQLFGDNEGWYPKGAYLDMVLVHTLHNSNEIDVLYKGLETPLGPEGNFGGLVALRDLRDGTNHTGMNPKNEKLIRHIGFSGHNNPPAMVEMIQRDEFGLLEGLLITINANDKTKFNMQHNVIPVAQAKGMGIIGMKAFADAALYHKEPTWSNKPEDVYMKIGSGELPSRPLIEYSLTTPGVHTLIVGIGHIDNDPMKCQLVQNFYASQVEPSGMSEAERKKIERQAAKTKAKSNYFQMEKVGLTPPSNVRTTENQVVWDTAFSGDSPVVHYEILINGEKKGSIKHEPQILRSKPFSFKTEIVEKDKIAVVAIDLKGNKAEATLV